MADQIHPKRTNWIIPLENHFPADSWSWIAAALRQDALIWKTLDQEGLAQRGLAVLPGDADHWSPAVLALLSLDYAAPLESLRTLPLRPISQPVRHRAVQALEDWLAQPENLLQNLGQAGMIALALREKRVNDSWEGVLTSLDLSHTGWGTILACLYGMIPDPFDMLRVLILASETTFQPDLLIHAILSNPIPPEEQREIFDDLLVDLAFQPRLAFLRCLVLQRPTLAADLAAELVEGSVYTIQRHRELSSQAEATLSLADWTKLLNSLDYLLQATESNQLADQWAEALPLISEAVGVSRRLQAGLSAHLAKLVSSSGSVESAMDAWKQAALLEPENPTFAAGMALALIDTGRAEDARVYLTARLKADHSDPHPSLWLVRARLARLSENKDEAREDVLHAYKLVQGGTGLAAIRNGLLDLSSILVEELLRDGFPVEAASIANLHLDEQPYDPAMLARLAQASLAQGGNEAALTAASLAVTLSPQDDRLKELQIQAQEACGEWQAALATRSLLLEKSFHQASLAELHALAQCALKAGQPEQAIEPCQKAIERNPDDGQAYAYLGQAHFVMGERAAAMKEFELATELAPTLAVPWLALAEAYEHSNQPDKAHEVLRAASQAAPNSAAIHLALGKAYLEENTPTQALAALRRAASLLQDTAGLPVSQEEDPKLPHQVAFYLGQTLRQLGHLDEARQVFESAYQLAEQEGQADPQLAYAYAQTLLGLSLLSQAIQPLERVVASQPDDPKPYIELARCLLEVDLPPVGYAHRAVECLKKALELDPEQVEAFALLGDACYADGAMQEALESYRRAYETALVKEPFWHARLAHGMGRACMALGQPETALVYLKEASQIDSLNPAIYQSLANTCLKLELYEDALVAARTALQLNPTQVGILSWFAEYAQDLYWASNRQANILPEAIQALSQAIQLDPSRVDLYQRLGSLYSESGNPASALRVYRELANLAILPDGSLTCLQLFQVAHNLRKLGDTTAAIQLLERAITLTIADLDRTNAAGELSPDAASPDAGILVELWIELAMAQIQAKNGTAALEALDNAIVASPQESWLYIKKADLLIETGEPAEALSALERALEFSPEDLCLQFRVAALLQATGNPGAAIIFVEKALQAPVCDELPATRIDTLCLAGNLARSLLRPDRAESLLKEELPTTEDKDALREYHALRADLAFDTADEELICSSISALSELDPEHPRLLAYLARQSARSGDMDSALALLNQSLRWIPGEPPEAGMLDVPAVLIQRAQAEAALELGRWQVAIPMFQHLTSLLPNEPLANLQLARALVLRAEAQGFTQAAQVIEHSPGDIALEDEAYLLCKNSLEATSSLFDESAVTPTNRSVYNPTASTRWQARMEIAFKPGNDSAMLFDAIFETIPALPDDIAARVVNMGAIGEPISAGRAAQTYPRNPLVWSRQAMVLGEQNPHQALSAINRSLDNWSSQLPGYHYELPLIKALQAYLAFRDKDLDTAREAIQTALQAWPDEPRWHALLAELELYQADQMEMPEAVRVIALRSATSHLEQAAQLEPDQYKHLLRLGQIYLRQQAAIHSVQVLEEASQLDPGQPETWLALAHAYQATGNLEEAAASADRALEGSSDQTPPLLLLAEIALESDNPRAAYNHAQAALRLKPDDIQGLYLLVRSLEELNRPAEALTTLERLIQLTPQPFALELERARLLSKAQGENASLEALRDLVARYPEEPLALASLAQALLAVSETEQAIQAAQQALQNGQGKLSSQEEADLNFLIGHYSLQSGQLDLAIHHLSATIELIPDHLEAYLDLGSAFQERRQPALALETYKQAISIASHDYRPYYQAGLVMKEIKDYQSAEGMLTRASALAPNELSIHRLLAAVVALNLIHNRRIPASSPYSEK